MILYISLRVKKEGDVYQREGEGGGLTLYIYTSEWIHNLVFALMKLRRSRASARVSRGVAGVASSVACDAFVRLLIVCVGPSRLALPHVSGTSSIAINR